MGTTTSSTFKIDGSLVIDPRQLTWAQLETFLNGGIGQKRQSFMRSAILEFPVLTASAYNTWIGVCDDNLAHDVYVPERLDGAFATNPEAVTDTGTLGSYTKSYASKYSLHFLGMDYSFNGRAYNVQILIYMYMKLHLIFIG